MGFWEGVKLGSVVGYGVGSGVRTIVLVFYILKLMGLWRRERDRNSLEYVSDSRLAFLSETWLDPWYPLCNIFVREGSNIPNKNEQKQNKQTAGRHGRTFCRCPGWRFGRMIAWFVCWNYIYRMLRVFVFAICMW